MIFPVPGGSFSPGWGAPRSGGRSHKGVDIFAPRGTPIYAPSDGRIENTSGNLSGLAVRFFDGQGNKYFMGHLDSNSGPARQVRAGEIIGYVGNTGNAKSTSPHVHFEFHPGGGGAVNPYGLLKSWVSGTGYSQAGYQQPAFPHNNPYLAQTQQAANAYGVPLNLLNALFYYESSYNPRAVSSAGAKGVAQFMPGTWGGSWNPHRGNDPFDPQYAIPASALYLANLYKAHGSWERALSAYNSGKPDAYLNSGQVKGYVDKIMQWVGASTGMAQPTVQERYMKKQQVWNRPKMPSEINQAYMPNLLQPGMV